MGRYSLFLQSSGAPGGPNSHQSGGCFSFTVTLHTCNSPETLASVPNSPGILVFSRTKCYAYGLATVKNSYLLNVCLLNVPGDAVCRYTQNPSRFLLLVFHNSRKPQDSNFFSFCSSSTQHNIYFDCLLLLEPWSSQSTLSAQTASGGSAPAFAI